MKRIVEPPFSKQNNSKMNLVDPLIQTVLDVRQQGQLVCNYLAPVELPSLLYTMALCTLCMLSALLILSGVSWRDGDD